MGTQPMQVQIGVLPGGMKPEELLVQLVAGPGDGNGFTDTPDVVDMARTEESTADRLVYACAYSPSRSGPHVYGAGLAAGDAAGPVGINRISSERVCGRDTSELPSVPQAR